MPDVLITRAEIIQSLKTALEPLPFVHAMWEGGAAAFRRVDEWSDVDLQVDVDDDQAEMVIELAAQTLEILSPLDISYVLPKPTWHGHDQAFFRLSGASKFLLVDFCAIHHSGSHKFLEPEIHGEAIIHFDKDGSTKVTPISRTDFASRLEERLHVLRTQFDLFQILPLKEAPRGNSIDALAFYHSYTLRPLVEALRVLHCPAHWNFATRYVHYDLPSDAAERLEYLYYVSDVKDLLRKRIEAELWFYRTLEEIDLIGVQNLVEQYMGTSY